MPKEYNPPPDEAQGYVPPPDEADGYVPPPDEEGSDTIRQVGRAATAPVRYARAGMVGLKTLGEGFLPAVEKAEDPSVLFGRAAERTKAALEPGFQPQGIGEQVASGIGTLAGVAPAIAAVSMAAPAVIPASVAGLLPAAVARAGQAAFTFGAIGGADEFWDTAAKSGKFPTAPEEAKAILKGSAFGAAMGFAGAVPALVAGRLPQEVSQGIYRALIPRVLGATAEGAVGGAAAALEGGSPTDIAVNGVLMALAGFMGNEGYDAQFKQAAMNQAIKPVVDKMVASGMTREAAQAQVEPAFKRLLVDTAQSHPDFPAAVENVSKRFQAFQPGMTKEMADKAAAEFVGKAAADGKLVKIDELARMELQKAPAEAPGAPLEPPKALEAQVPAATPEVAPATPQVAPVPEIGAMVRFKTDTGEVSGVVQGYNTETGQPIVEVQESSGAQPPAEVGDVVPLAPEGLSTEEPVPEWLLETEAPEVTEGVPPTPLAPSRSIHEMKPDEFTARFGKDKQGIYIQAMKEAMKAGRNVPEEALAKYPELLEGERAVAESRQAKELKQAGFSTPDELNREIRRAGGFDLDALEKSHQKGLAGLGEMKAFDAMRYGLFRRGGFFKSFDDAADYFSSRRNAAGYPFLKERDPNELIEKMQEGIRAKSAGGAGRVSEPGAEEYYRAAMPEEFEVPQRTPDWLPERLKGSIEKAGITEGGAVTSKGFTDPAHGRIKRGEVGKFLAADLENGQVLAQFGEKVVVANPWDIAETYAADEALTAGQPPAQPEGRAVKAAADVATGVRPVDDEMVAMSKAALLKVQLSNQQKGSIVAAQAVRREMMASMTRMMREGKDIRQLLAKFSREAMAGLQVGPVQVGQIARLVAKAQTEFDFMQAMISLENVIDVAYGRQLNSEIQTIWQRSMSAPGVEVGWKQKMRESYSDIDFDHIAFPSAKILARGEASAEYLAHAEEFGQAGLIPESRKAEAIRIGKRPLSVLSNTEREEIRDVLLALEKTGRMAQKYKELIRQLRVERVVSELVKDVVPVTRTVKVERTIGVDESLSMMSEIRNRIAAMTDWAQDRGRTWLTAEAMLDLADGQKEMIGAHVRLVKHVADDIFHDANQKEWEWTRPRRELIKKYGPLTQKEDEIIMIVLTRNQAGGKEHLMSNRGYGKTPEARKAVIEGAKLDTDKLKDFAKMYLAFGADKAILDETIRIERAVFNREFKNVSDYFPFINEHSEYDNMPVSERLADASQNRYARKEVQQKFVEARMSGVESTVLASADRSYLKHVRDVAWLHASQEKLVILAEAVNRPEYARQAEPFWTKHVRDYVTLLTRQGGVDGARKMPKLDAMRANIASFHLGWRITTAMVQSGSYPLVAADYGPATASWGLQAMMDPAWESLLMENVPELRTRVRDMMTLEGIQRGALGSPAGKVEGARNAAMAFFLKTDMFFAAADFSAGYKRWHDVRGLQIDKTKLVRDAVIWASREMGRRQGTTNFKDLCLALSSGAFSGNVSVDRTIAQYQTYNVARANYIRQSLGYDIKNGRYFDAGFKASMIGAGFAVEFGLKSGWRVMIAAILAGSVAKAWDEETEKFWSRFSRQALGNFPVVGQAFEAANFKRLPIPLADVLLQAVGGPIRAAQAVIAGNRIKAIRETGNAIAGLGAMAGIPGGGVILELSKKVIGVATGSRKRPARVKRAKR